jgi:hypothetical protein
MDEAARALLTQALERLRVEMLSSLAKANIAPDSPIRDNILRALSDMKTRLEEDPSWAEQMLSDLRTRLR